MEVRIGSKVGEQIASPAQLVDHLAEQLRLRQQQWLEQLSAEPSRFADLEVTVHHTFQQLADQLMASLLAKATQQSPVLEAQKKN